MEIHLEDEEMQMESTTDEVVQAVSDIGLKITQCSTVIKTKKTKYLRSPWETRLK